MLELGAALRDNGLVAILRSRADAPLTRVMRALVDAGVRIMEVTVPTPGSLSAIAAATAEFGGDVLVGAGTVTTGDQVRAARDAGAAFVVSPGFDLEVQAAAAGMGSLPGAFTPTEIQTAWRAGATAVKLFPAATLGARFVAELRGPLPDIPVVPTGGVGLADVRTYLDSGAVAVGVGSPLIGDALRGGSLAELFARAAAFVAATRQVRS
ncbi:bifunctional 4-hydroxy-2-oxoglutarate aldolase/2-dehydro-3-deoxy-phosphogluconate aldolase [Actinokineospora sp. HUAS TT18]|uniref:bifunctional 4-hydroxy-2-oxoglutarate aldolase/2-dehydro-3-deoxy-phosphogluconate aldolase n=1 Tax=Actinokineospora sp. HUAS TT18 TaxID=3447451 RepID=UPI003F51DD4B